MDRERSGRVYLAVSVVLVAAVAIGLFATPHVAQEEGDSKVAITVTADGEIESQHVVQELPPGIGEGMDFLSAFGDVDSLGEQVANAYVEDDNGIDDYEGLEERDTDDAYVVEFTLVDIDVDEMSDVDTTVEDGTVAFEMTGGEAQMYQESPLDESYLDAAGGSTVVVEMPGEVTETNALETDGSTATWHLHEELPDQLTVESGTEGGGDGGGDGIPGFGPAVAVVALAIAALAVGRRR
ncbi:LppM family (lipo)protein [Halopiger goleimassiliensis]|uniref:LppM family (lipo)protein n=1 Tax=Halopiger goleimassiliensis TaxID=1293048 RepID=UPI000677DC38|nr:PGF-CTERM sorting domain-containing protein [Halopiger goleimassiliensis]